MPEQFPFARRANWTLAANPLMAAFEELRNKKVSVLDLTESNPTRCGFASLQENIIAALSKNSNLVYVPSASGMLPARRAIAQYYRRKNISCDPSRIFLTSSTSEAYSFLLRLLLNPGERLLVPIPSYPLFQYLAELNDVELDHYPLRYENGLWSIDLDALAESVTSETRAIILVNPNNPTGSFLSDEELVVINAIARKHQLALIGDEVFLDFVLEERVRPLSLAENESVLTFTLGGISKSLGLPQMKLAWIATNGPADVVQAAIKRLEIILDTYLSVNTPVQNALPQWLEQRESIHQEIQERLRTNLQQISDQVAQTPGVQALTVHGGWYLILRLPDHRDEEEWVMDFLQKDHVFVHPGYFFDFIDEPYIVISLLPEPLIIQKGLVSILKRIQSARTK